MSEKESIYLRYARTALIKEGKFNTINLEGKKIREFSTSDVWLKMLEFHSLNNASKN
jgi:hypothetical protein